VGADLSEGDWAEFILGLADYYAFFAYLMFLGWVSG